MTRPETDPLDALLADISVWAALAIVAVVTVGWAVFLANALLDWMQ